MSHLSGYVMVPNVARSALGLLNGIAALRTALLLFATSIGGGSSRPVADRNSAPVDSRKQ
jgi:hypothetical protein